MKIKTGYGIEYGVVVIWDKNKNALANAIDIEILRKERLFTFEVCIENNELVFYACLDNAVNDYEIRICTNNSSARPPLPEEIVEQ